MYPTLLELDLPVIGRLTITSFGVMMAVAFLAGYQVMRVRLKELGQSDELAYELLIGALVGGLLGAKLYYVVLHWLEYGANPVALLFSRAGLVWYGGFIGGTLGVLWVVRRRRESFGFVSDLMAPALALSYGIGRIGCFLVGDDYGKPTDSWIGLKFPEGAPPTTAGNLRAEFNLSIPASVPDSAVLAVYPTQLFKVALALLIFLYLWPRRAHRHDDGWLCGLWLVLAGLERLAVEAFRAKDDRFFGPLTLAQVISLALIGVGVYVVQRLREGSGSPVAA